MRPWMALACVVALSPTAAAQDSRAALLERQRAAKATELRPYRAGRVEAFLFDVEDRYGIERLLNPPRGFFPRLGGFPTGAGFAAGPAFRHSNHHASFTLSAAGSTRRYWDAGATLALTNQARTRVFGDLRVRRREYPQEDFYGLGADSRLQARTNFAFRETSVAGRAGVAPTRRLSFSASAELLAIGVGRGRDEAEPPFDRLFTEATAPGFGAAPDFVRLGAQASADTTDRPFGSPLGGHYTVAYDRFLDRDQDAFAFGRWTLDLRQYVPVLGSTRTLALRAQLVSATPAAGHEVPFYLQPTLGGPDSLRGLPVYRLRDRNLLLLQAEYRWDLNAVLSGVLFYDAGAVARRLGDFERTAFRQDFGGGLRIGLLATAFFRAEVAFGAGEGTVVVVRFGSAF